MSEHSPHSTKYDQLGDESFMSAQELREYMNGVQIASVSKNFDAMAQADLARNELVKTLSQPVEFTPQFIAELKHRLESSAKAAAEEGANEIMVMRFPNALCSDHGRAINNSEEGWPETLTGRPRQAYEFWRDHLRPAKYKLKAMIIQWPGGLPGDVGFFLNWSETTK